MKQKHILILCLTLAALLLFGCGCEHEWADATCTAPKTCSLCGKTDGKPLPHSWIDATCAAPKTCADCGLEEGGLLDHTWADATCAAPKTCTVCGETEGEALPHERIVPANYQDPSVCADCGTEVADKLVPIYEQKGVEITIVPGEPFAYTTATNAKRDLLTTGAAVLTDYGVLDFAEDAELIAELAEKLACTIEPREGYEWRAVRIEVRFDDKNAIKHGVVVNWLSEDYYDPYLRDNTEVELENGLTQYSISWHGETVPAYCASECQWNSKRGKYSDLTILYAVCVPIGYDGAVFGPLRVVEDVDYNAEAGYFVDDADAYSDACLYRLK